MRFRTFLGMWAILALTVGVTVVVRDRLDAGTRASDQTVSGPDGAVGATSTTTGAPEPIPADGEIAVRGRVTALHLDGAVLQPRRVATPITVTSERGFGNGAELTGVVVDGQPSTIVWDGGRPLVLSGGGGLELDPVSVDLVDGSLRLLLGGRVHGLEAGTYRLDAPVAVGTSGIATPYDSVTFDAGPDARLDARGDATLTLSPDVARRVVGPGRVRLDGMLEITDRTGTRSVDRATLDQGAYDLTFTPDGAGGWLVGGVMDAPTSP